MKKLLIAIASVFTLTITISEAAVIKKGASKVIPQMYSESGKFQGCGLTILTTDESATENKKLIAYTFITKLNVSYIIAKKEYFSVVQKPSIISTPVPFHSFWIRFGDRDPQNTISATAGDNYSKLELLEIAPTLSILAEILRKPTNVNIGVKDNAEGNEEIISSLLSIDKVDAKLYLECLKEFEEKSKK